MGTLSLPTLDEVRTDLERGLSSAIFQSGRGRVSREEATQGARSVLVGQGLPSDVEARFGSDPVCALVSFDADRIQSWVFASERVQVAKGASATLENLNESVLDKIQQVDGIAGVVYSAGGGGMLFASCAADLGAIEERLRRWLEAKSRELTFTVVSLPLYARDLLPASDPKPLASGGKAELGRFQLVDGIRGALVRLQIKVRQIKDARPRFGGIRSLLESRQGAPIERCPSCNRRPPSQSPLIDDGPETWCPWCQDLRRACLRFAREDEESTGPSPTFSDLAEAADRRRKYLGFVAIDGNGMGSVVQGLSDFVQLRAFSVATTEIYRVARGRVEGVLAQGFLEKGWSPERAGLSLLSGGDEITLVLPAAAAPQTAAVVLREIEAGFNAACSLGGLLQTAFQETPVLLERLRGAGAAAGFVAARPQFPVRLLRRYAEALQKQAKRICGPNGARSAVAWSLLSDTSPSPEGEVQDRLEDLSLASHERLLVEAKAADTVKVPPSALWSVLSQCRSEEQSIRSIPAGPGRDQVLAVLAANFFRYQMARNRRLRDWWGRVAETWPGEPSAGDGVEAWFQAGGIHRLERMMDLLTLEPFSSVPVEEWD